MTKCGIISLWNKFNFGIYCHIGSKKRKKKMNVVNEVKAKLVGRIVYCTQFGSD